MSGRVCYLARAGVNDSPAVVRLVSSGADEAWERRTAPADAADAIAQTGDAAAWVAERAARGDGPRGEVALLCVDVEGASCSWLTVPSSDASVVVAAMMQTAGEIAGSDSGGAWGVPSGGEATIQALAPPMVRKRSIGRKQGPGLAASKLAVIAAPDVDARLFMDALDELGVTVERAVSLWHAIAMAWDPAVAAAAEGREGVVASSAPMTAVLVVDPAGRLVWAWSQSGELAAAGTIRVLRERREGETNLLLSEPDVARLTTDWLAWSVQLGGAPSRVVCVGPRLSEDEEDGLSAAALGTAIGRAWPGATVDLAVHDDPIGATMRRLAAAEIEGPGDGDGRSEMVSLTRRPGRAHRSMFRWGALCLLAVAGVLGALAHQTIKAAGEFKQAEAESRGRATNIATEVVTPASDPEREMLKDSPMSFLQSQANRKRQALNPNTGLEPAKPILEELEAISLVLGVKNVQIEQINLYNSNLLVQVVVPEVRTAEELKVSLDSVSDRRVEWQLPAFGGGRGGKQVVTFNGRWKARPVARGGTP